MSRKSEFEALGAPLKNFRASWSAVNETERLVVLFLWKDLLEDGVYEDRDDGLKGDWTKLFGNKERMGHIRWSRTNAASKFTAVVGRAEDTKAVPRRIARNQSFERYRMEFTRFDETTGEFTAKVLKRLDV